MQKILDKVSGILFFVAFLPYIWAILFHGVTPSPLSWILWTSIDIPLYFFMKKKGLPTEQVLGAIFGAGTTTVLALFYGTPIMFEPSAELFVNIASAVITIGGIALWLKTGDAQLAITANCVALVSAALPTFYHGWVDPNKEDPIAWSIWWVSCAFALFAIPKGKWDMENALPKVTFTFIESTMVTLVVIVPYFMK